MLKAGYEYWKDKKINCLGDSITFGAGNDGYSWVDMLRELMPEADIRKYGVSGSTLSYLDGRDDAFIDRMADMQMDYDLCIVFGGVNDFNHGLPLGKPGAAGTERGDANSFYAALEYMVGTLSTVNPAGELMFITPMKSRDFKGYPHWDSENAAGYKLIDYRNAILDVCRRYSIPALDLFSMSGITADIPALKVCVQPDGLHPSRLGYERMARKIYGFITTQL